MENIPIKLNSLEPEFHYFEDNQVLTAGQLNQVVDYFDRQTRLSRTRLTGTGIVCGLDLKEVSDSQIVLTKGTGLTTDGDLLQLAEDTKYTLYTEFEDTKAQYPSFLTEEDTPQQIKLFRLYPEGFTNPQIVTKPLAGLSAEGVDIEKMVLVLYLNSYLEPPEECTEIGCDNRGPRQRQELVPLLISRDDLDTIVQQKTNPYFDLPEVAIRRVALTHAPNNADAASAPIDSRSDLLNRFKVAIDASATDLTSALLKICGNEETKDWLFQLIAPSYNGNTPIIDWEDKLGSIFGTASNTLGIQYIHEFMKDLAQAYNEFKACIFDLCVDCCPDTNLFPKHLMVRELVSGTSFLPYNYRNYFCESPALNRADIRVQKAVFLHQRIDRMIASFAIPATATDEKAIEITPVNQNNIPLAQAPIPFYYQNTSIVENWNFEKQRRGLSNTVLGYHNRTSTTAAATAIAPFLYCQRAADFFKIEGHIGLELEAVEQQLEALKKKYNISFLVEKILIEKQRAWIPLPPNFRLPSAQFLLDMHRETLVDRIASVKDYNNQIRTLTLDTELFKGDPALRTEVEDAQAKVDRLNTQLDKVQANIGLIGSPIKKFETSFTTFKTEYETAINIGHDIKTKVFNAAVTKAKNPLQDFVFQNKMYQFDRLLKYKKAKEEKVKEQYIFDIFLDNNMGLAHLGGVPNGGTFVLVYTQVGNKKTVVADFCLSYCCTFKEDPEVEIAQEDLPIQPPIKILDRENELPFKWVQNFDIVPIPKVRTQLAEVIQIKEQFDIAQNDFYKTIVTDVVNRPLTAPTGDLTNPADFRTQFEELLNPAMQENLRLVDEKFAARDQTIRTMRTDYQGRIATVDGKVASLQSSNQQQFSSINQKLTQTQTTFNQQIGTIQGTLNTYTTRVDKNTTNINANITSIKAANAKVDKFGARVDVVGTRVDTLGTRLGPATGGNVTGPGGRLGGNVTGPGGLTGGRAVSPRQAEKKIDDINKLYMNTLTQSRLNINDLAKKKKRKAKEEKDLKTLQKMFKDAANNLLAEIEHLKKDIKAADSTTTILESLKINKAAVKDTMDTRSLTTKINKLIKKHADKPKLIALLKEL